MKKLRDFRGPKQSEKRFAIPQQPQQGRSLKVHHIPFSLKEIDMIMQGLIEANVPAQVFLLLDEKFRNVRQKASVAVDLGEVMTLQSKMNEGAVAIEEYNEKRKYEEGDSYFIKVNNGKRVYRIEGGERIEITVNEDLASNGPGEIN